MKGQWEGGKGSTRRKQSNDKVYRDNWEKIFEKPRTTEERSKSKGNESELVSDMDIRKEN